MPGVADQIRELVRSVTNHARRIRRLETLQAPLAVVRPQGGHIVQDEGVDLTERVYLNFVGVRVDASDDPESGATIITVSDPDDDDFCRVTPLDVGWQINAGTESRYMKHSAAFQLSSYGDTRGAYAIDLQQVQDNPDEVAGGDYSIILGGEENRITGAGDYSSISGGDANYLDDAYDCHIHGSYNELYNDCSAVHVSGENMDLDEVTYGFFAGLSHEVSGVHAFGNALVIWTFGEDNEFISNANDYPTYCGSMGISNIIEGDSFLVFQWGEQHESHGVGTPGETTLWCTQMGFETYLEHVHTNFAFGQDAKSYRPTYDGFYDGRIVWSGEYPNDSAAGDGSGHYGGYNQDSWFSQNDFITNWTVAWITSRFEFPIIQDSIWGFSARILGTEQGCANTYDWRIRGMVENDGGVTTIRWSIVDNYYRDVATKEWRVVADDPNDRLVFQFRDTNGPDATNCNIQLSLDTVEVGYGA